MIFNAGMAIYDNYLTVIKDSTPALSRQISRRGFVRLSRGIYVNNPSKWRALEAWERHKYLCAAVTALNSDAILAGGSAALVAGLPFEGSPKLVHVRSGGATRTTNLCAYTRSTAHILGNALAHELDDASIIQTTSYEDIVIDTALWNGVPVSLPIADHLLRHELITTESLATAVKGRGRQPGIAKARLVQACATPLSESPRESEFRLALLEMGLGDFYIQADIVDDTGTFIGRVDFLFPQYGLAIEYDGAGKYQGQYGNNIPHTLRKDMTRHHRFTNAGIRLLRINNALFTSGRWVDVIRTAISKSQPRDALPEWQFSGGLFVPMSVSWLVTKTYKLPPADLAA